MDKKLFVVTLALAGIVLLYSVLQQARSYEDCVLKNMPQPKGELTATYSVQLAVERLCRDKYPRKPELLPRVNSARLRAMPVLSM